MPSPIKIILLLIILCIPVFPWGKVGHVINLHSLWDNLVEIKAAEDPEKLGGELNNKISAAERQKWASGTIDSWVFESYMVAKTKIYPSVRPDKETVTALPREYFDKMRPVAEEQLEKSGIRLAKVLEEVFGEK
jgi:hypothetical protein